MSELSTGKRDGEWYAMAKFLQANDGLERRFTVWGKSKEGALKVLILALLDHLEEKRP